MKKLLLKGLSIVCVFGLSLNVSAQNLCVNGDFEAALAGTTNTKIPNWIVDYGSDFNAVTGSNAITSQSIRINSKNAKYLTSDVINITAGHTYKLTFTARVQDVAGDSGTGNPVGSITGIIIDGTANGPLSGFTALTVTSNSNTTATGNFTAPMTGDGSSTVRVRFTRAAYTVGYVGYIDGVSFEDLGVLPISLTSFTGIATNNGVTLNWTTANENNNKTFTISSSTNGTDFTKIETLNGAGNANNITNYAFTDKAPAHGVNYYKITQTDFDGKTISFDPIAVSFDLTTKDDLSVYATQTKLQGKVNWTIDELVAVTVIDLNGRTMLTERINLKNGLNSFTLNGGSLVSSTIYVLTLSSSTHTTSTKFYIN